MVEKVIVDHEHLAVGTVALVALLAISGVLIRRLDFFTLRIFEGYWPSWIGLHSLRQILIKVQNCHIQCMEDRWQSLAKRDNLSAWELEKRDTLDWRLAQYPDSIHPRLPTRLGNILRTSELWPSEKYGLDPIICWPRLWLLLPEDTRTQLSESRSTLDSHASMATCGVMLLIWAFIFNIGWMVLVSASVAYLAYRFAIAAADSYGSLVKSVFDLHRGKLYSALRWPMSNVPSEEKKSGEAISMYLFRGVLSSTFKFDDPIPEASNECH